MQIEIGAIAEGKVTGITNYGAFVALDDKTSGMVHISEISSGYVKNIRDYLTEQQSVRVKVIGIDEKGRIALSIRQAQEPSGEEGGQKNRSRRSDRPDKGYAGGSKGGRGGQRAPRAQDSGRQEGGIDSAPPVEYSAPNKRAVSDDAFEDMMARFKAESDEKISDLKKSVASKRPGFSRRGSGNDKF